MATVCLYSDKYVTKSVHLLAVNELPMTICLAIHIDTVLAIFQNLFKQLLYSEFSTVLASM